MQEHCEHGRKPDRCTECAVTTDRDQLAQANALLRKELDVQKGRADHWHGLARWAANRTTEALMVPATKPREAREARDKALCDINKKIGGALR